MLRLCRCSIARTISARQNLATSSSRQTSSSNRAAKSPPGMYSRKNMWSPPSEKEKAAFTRNSPEILLKMLCSFSRFWIFFESCSRSVSILMHFTAQQSLVSTLLAKYTFPKAPLPRNFRISKSFRDLFVLMAFFDSQWTCFFFPIFLQGSEEMSPSFFLPRKEFTEVFEDRSSSLLFQLSAMLQSARPLDSLELSFSTSLMMELTSSIMDASSCHTIDCFAVKLRLSRILILFLTRTQNDITRSFYNLIPESQPSVRMQSRTSSSQRMSLIFCITSAQTQRWGLSPEEMALQIYPCNLLKLFKLVCNSQIWWYLAWQIYRCRPMSSRPTFDSQILQISLTELSLNFSEDRYSIASWQNY